MFKSRLSILLMLLALLAVFVPATAAQDETFGLSAEDFQRLGTAISQSGEAADSLGFDFTVNLSVEGEGGGAIALNGTGLIGSNENGAVAQINITGENEGEPVSLDVIVIDNIIYVNDGSGWQGQSADDLLESFGSMSPVPLDSVMGGGDMAQNPEAMQGMSDAMTALGEINPADYITMTNAGDEGGATHFTIDFDLQGFLSSPAFSELLSAGAAMSGDETAAAQAEGMGQMVAMMFQDTNLQINYYIGADDLVQRFGVDFGLGINPAMMGASDAQPVNVSLLIDASNFQYGADVSGIVAPEGATMAEG
jgi:hypothetical protein